ncbi:MAG: nuclear transport factor 2 family protein [Panacagrimonas sp.]
MNDETSKPQSEAQRKLLQLVRHWEKTYNSDVERLVLDCYAPDAHLCFNSAEVRGHAQLMRVVKGVLGACPTRKMRVDRVMFSGEDTAIVEAVVLDRARTEFYSPFCTILRVQDGKIAQDRTYLEPTRWPGLEGAVAHVSPGGLGGTRGLG